MEATAALAACSSATVAAASLQQRRASFCQKAVWCGGDAQHSLFTPGSTRRSRDLCRGAVQAARGQRWGAMRTKSRLKAEWDSAQALPCPLPTNTAGRLAPKDTVHGSLAHPPDAVAAEAAVVRRQARQHSVVGIRHSLHTHHQGPQALPLRQQVLGRSRHAIPLPLKVVALLQRRRQLGRQVEVQQAACRPVLAQQIVLQVAAQVKRNAAVPLKRRGADETHGVV